MNIRNIIQSTLQDEKKKKVLIIGLAVFLIIIGAVFFLTRTPSAPQDDSQLLSDIAGLAPRDTLLNRNFQLAPTIELSADPVAIAPGQSTKISWVASNATSCVSGEGDAINLQGDLSVSPAEPYTFEVRCVGPKGTEIRSITVVVTTAPIINLIASPSAVVPGGQSLISWNTVNADRCVDSASSTLRLSGSTSVSPKKPYTFSMSCVGPKGASTKSVTIAMAAPPKYASKTTYTPPLKGTATEKGVATETGTTPVETTTVVTAPDTVGKAKITMSASTLKVKYGEASIISWQTQDAKNCTGTTPTGLEMFNPTTNESIIIQPGYPPIPLPESGQVSIRVLDGKRTATLTIQCEGPDGTKTTRSITITSEARIPGACEGTIRPTFTSFSAVPKIVETAGSASVVTWNTRCATSCTASVVPSGELITYPDVSAIPDYVEGQDYNKYTPTRGIQNLGVNTSGGVRVHPGVADKEPALLDKLCEFTKMCTPSSSGSTATVSVKCTNSDTGYSVTKSVTVGIVQKKGGCKSWYCKVVNAVAVAVVILPVVVTTP